MISDITIGQFFPGKSVLHRMDPRVKIVLMFFFIVSIFLIDGPIPYGALTLLTVILGAASGIPARIIVKSVKPLWWILLFTFLIHFATMPGRVVAQLWIFQFTEEGFWRGFFISLRLILLIVLSSYLTLTTSPLMLTDALERLLSPLKCVGVPAHELAMMMTIALRFIPTLMEETDKIMKAQKSRGSDIGEGNLIAKAKSMIPILVPLFISAFRRADELAMAMEARSYRGGEGRTRMKAMRMHKSDGWAIGMMAVYMMACGAVYWLV